jgi:hypothetical protein
MSPSARPSSWRPLLALVLATGLTTAAAQSEGGLYIAGAGFTFQEAAERGLSQNPGGRRFFLLSLPPESAALTSTAPPAMVRLRERVLAANGVLLVCQRDLDNGRIDVAALAAGVVPVRGNPAAGSNDLPAGQRYFAGENPANLPAANKALRRLRSTCA